MIETLRQWKERGRFLAWRGHQLFVVDSLDHDPMAASKPVLLLLHGYPTSTWDFDPLWAQLAARFRVVGADLLGLGFSSKPRPHRYCMAEQADLMEFVLQHAGVQACHVLAHDYGDTVAQELLARDLDRAGSRYRSVVLLNGGLFPETHRARPMQKRMAGPLGPLLARLTSRRRLLETFSAVFGADTRPDEPILEAVWQLVNFNEGVLVLPSLLGYIAERKQFRERWVNALRTARVPLALVNGSADPVSGAHMVARFREVVGTHHFVRELPGIGHYPQLEAPQSVLEACVEFWGGIDPAQECSLAATAYS